MAFLIAHRGARKFITENTKESIFLAFQYGATHAEIDVRRTKDGKLILFHDPITFRFDGKISTIRQVTAEYMQNLSLPRGGRITLLEELLVSMRNRYGKLVIELKHKGMENDVYDLLKKNQFTNRVIIWSFDHQIIQRFSLISERKVLKAILLTIRPWSNEAIRHRVRDTGADFVYPVLRKLDNEWFYKNSIGIIRATQNPEEAAGFLRSGGTGIMTANIAMFSAMKELLYPTTQHAAKNYHL